MDPTVAAKIVALRPALENLVTKATADPDSIDRLGSLDQRLVRLVRELSSPRAASFGFESSDGELVNGVTAMMIMMMAVMMIMIMMAVMMIMMMAMMMIMMMVRRTCGLQM